MITTLLVIDPQIDFCDPEHGALAVRGADADMVRLVAMIRRVGNRINRIVVTLDSHHWIDIAHPGFWVDDQDHHPKPFTIITPAEVEERTWSPADPAARDRALEYVLALARNGRYPLCIWPTHCLIGSAGHAVSPDLFSALTEWESAETTSVTFVAKGENVWTEHYSAIQADVPDPDDPATQINHVLISALSQSDTILVGGEAGSHCVANTVRDLADNLPDERDIRKIILLTDAVSPVTGFEALQEKFVSEMTARGMRLATTIDLAL